MQRQRRRTRALPSPDGPSPRNFGAGVYHLSAHASAERRLFLDDTDRRAFLDLLNITWAKLGLELISYVLMTNHYHALTWIPDKRLSQALQIVHGQYSREHNKRHRHSAHLFRAHSFTRRLLDDNELLASEHYLAHNPVRAAWGTARTHAGLEPSAVFLSEQRLRGALGEPADWRERYSTFVQAWSSRAA